VKPKSGLPGVNPFMNWPETKLFFKKVSVLANLLLALAGAIDKTPMNAAAAAIVAIVRNPDFVPNIAKPFALERSECEGGLPLKHENPAGG